MSTTEAFRLGGALGIGAVAINTWIKNWEHVKEIFASDWSHGAAGVIRSITDALLTGAASLVNFERLLGKVSMGVEDLARKEQATAQFAAQKATNEQAAKSAESAVSGVGATGAEARGALFREAVGKYGGGPKLRDEMLQSAEGEAVAAARRRAAANPALNVVEEEAAARKKARDSVNLEIAKAMRGDSDAINRIAKGRPGLPGAVDVEQQAIEAQGLANDRAFRAKQREKAEAERQQQADYEQQGREYERNFQAKQRDKTRAEAGRFANALSPSVGKSLLQNGAMSDEELEGKVRKAMEKAGIAADVIGRTLEETAKNLREEMKEKISARALERGITEGAAAQQLLREQNEREKAQNAKEHPKAEILSTESYLNKVLVASLSTKGDEIPKDQLQAQRDALEKLDAIKDAIEKAKGAPVAARFAAKGAH